MCEFYSNIALLPHMKFSIGPLASITAARVLQHQCDRINTSKGKSGPTAASHTPYSTFHVLLRFTTISRKPTASQTEKKKIMGPTCCYQASSRLHWNITNSVFDERLEFMFKKGFWTASLAGMQRLELLLQSCRMAWCNYLKVEGGKTPLFISFWWSEMIIEYLKEKKYQRESGA